MCSIVEVIRLMCACAKERGIITKIHNVNKSVLFEIADECFDRRMAIYHFVIAIIGNRRSFDCFEEANQ